MTARPSSWRLPLTALACLCLVGCGDDDATSSPGAEPGARPGLGTLSPGGSDASDSSEERVIEANVDTSFSGSLAAGICEWLMTCCTSLEQKDYVAAIAGTANDGDAYDLTLRLQQEPSLCQGLVKGAVVQSLLSADAAVLSGRASYNDEATSACLETFDGTCGVATNADMSRPDHPCHPEQLVDGLVAEDGMCTEDLECTSGTYCDVVLGATLGTCRRWAALGDPCDTDVACGSEGYCGGLGELGVCVEASGSLAPYCNVNSDCGSGQYCATSINTCVDGLAVGSVCQLHASCVTGFCALDSSQTCEETRGLNELCGTDMACGDEGYCDDTPPDISRCLALTELGEGERCDLGAAICGEGLLCEDGLCVTRSGMGGPCVSDDYCPSNGWCDAGSCSPRQPVGGSCQSDSQCVAIAWCQGNTCESRVAVGLSCDANTRCSIGAYCLLTDGVLGTCQPLPSAGSDCVDGACGEGLGCVTYTGICSARVGSNANCERSAMCAPDQVCTSPNTASDVCQAPMVVGLGAACLDASVTCATGFYCGAEGECIAYSVSGGPCTLDEHCVSGTSCVAGTCKIMGGAFATCDSQADCASGLYCDEPIQQCAPEKTVDQNCNLDVECQGELYCNSASLTCAWKKGSSEPCTAQGECQDTLYCNVAGSCAQRLGVGLTCNVTEACMEGLGCVDGLCTAPASPGMMCNPVMGCAEGSSCDVESGLCKALSTSGESCGGDADCIPELFCGALSATCSKRGDLGDACDQSGGCLNGLACQQSGLCRARGAVGASCDPFESQCVAGALCDPSGVCVALNGDRAIGEPCTHHDQCATQSCESSVCVGYCQGIASPEAAESDAEEEAEEEAEETAMEEAADEETPRADDEAPSEERDPEASR